MNRERVEAINGVEVVPVTQYSEELSAGIGRLMHQLDKNFNDDPISRERIEEIIASPHHDILVAIKDGEVLGTATMMDLIEPVFKAAYLGAFVVDEKARGTGIADLLWDAVVRWARERGHSTLHYQSESWRGAALHFYKDKKGAKQLENTVVLENYLDSNEKPEQ